METGHALRLCLRPFGQFLLDLQAVRTGLTFLGHESTETVFASFPMIRQLPGLDRPQSYGQTGCYAEYTLVVLVDFGPGPLFARISICIHKLRIPKFAITEDNIGAGHKTNNW